MVFSFHQHNLDRGGWGEEDNPVPFVGRRARHGSLLWRNGAGMVGRGQEEVVAQPFAFLSVCTSLSISFSCGVPCIKASSSSYANEVH